MIRKDTNIRSENKLGLTLLHIAMLHEEGDESIVKTLLEKGLDVNHKTKDGLTPLDIATEIGFKAGVEALLSQAHIKAGLSKIRIKNLQLLAHVHGHREIKKLFEALSGLRFRSAEEFRHTNKR